MGIKAKWFTGIFLTLNALLHAQQNKIDTLRIYHIDEVTITSSKVSSKEIIPVQIMEGKQLEKLSVHSVADAIRYFSGVQIKDFGGIGGLKTVNIRSMGRTMLVYFTMALNWETPRMGKLTSVVFLLTIWRQFPYTTDNAVPYSSLQKISDQQVPFICKVVYQDSMETNNIIFEEILRPVPSELSILPYFGSKN